LDRLGLIIINIDILVIVLPVLYTSVVDPNPYCGRPVIRQSGARLLALSGFFGIFYGGIFFPTGRSGKN
jgi:hypothetical protein